MEAEEEKAGVLTKEEAHEHLHVAHTKITETRCTAQEPAFAELEDCRRTLVLVRHGPTCIFVDLVAAVCIAFMRAYRFFIEQVWYIRLLSSTALYCTR